MERVVRALPAGSEHPGSQHGGAQAALTADGGQEQPCGWLKDRWGLSWQIIPDRLIELIRDPDPDRSHRAVQAMLQMRKIEIAVLEAAVADS